jgi:hypothetical protein
MISLKKDSILINSEKFERYSVKYYEINHFGIFKEKTKNRNLLIYHQGHGGDPFDFEYFLEIKEKFFQNEHDILTLCMTGLGFNLEKDKKIYYPGYKIGNPKDHDYFYKDYFDPNFPNKKPLSLMLSGNYYLIKNIIKNKNYDNIVMLGESGGGWQTTVLSSIIPQIKQSFSFTQDNNVPIFLNWSNRHWEEIGSELWDYANYDDLYNLATLDKDLKRIRHHYLISYPYEQPAFTLLKKLNDKKPIKNFHILSFIKDQHNEEELVIDIEYLFKKFSFKN